MTKSRAEIQREYRERQKAKGSAFLEKERARQKSYYTPAAKLSKKKREERNHKNKLRNRLSRFRKHQRRTTDGSNETSGYESASTSVQFLDQAEEEPARLIVKMPVQSLKAKGLKKTKERMIARTKKEVSKLKRENAELRKTLKTRNRKILRLNDRLKRAKNTSTPDKQTDSMIETLQLTPRRTKAVRRQLLTSNVLMSEIKATRQSVSKKKRRSISCIVSGAIAKKYRRLNSIHTLTGLSRWSLKKATDKSLVGVTNKERRHNISKKFESLVLDFYNRDDNSRLQPGKSDVKKVESGKKDQTRFLTDYLKNLHQKFLSENPNVRISLSTFQRLRPKNVLLTSFISRNTCQCIHHENMALKAQALRAQGIKVGLNPESLIGMNDLESAMDILPEKVPYKVWKRVEESGKSRMKVVEEEKEKETFKKEFLRQLKSFSEHVSRVREQYNQIRVLKGNLHDDQMILQMDFSENFSCRSLNEIQTAYWNQAMVTLHPIVVYFKDGETLKHQSLVVVSNELSHSSGTVVAFLDRVIPLVKEMKPSLRLVHYWTDSPSSQYRNRSIFHVVANHTAIYGIAARWNYFEAGHGKGPCDGLGGTVKRMADETVRQGNNTIQDAQEFFNWATHSSLKNVKFIYVDECETQSKIAEMNQLQTKVLKGTMQIHAVGITEDPTAINYRSTSCYCAICLTGDYCSTWNTHKYSTTDVSQTRESAITDNNDEAVEDEPEVSRACKEHDLQKCTPDISNMVAAVYEGTWYLGEVVDKDSDDQEVEVRFMVKAKTMFKWPQREDKIWIKSENVLCLVKSLSPSGKSQRLFKISVEEEQLIQERFTAKCLK